MSIGCFGQVFVDLYAVVRHGIRASVESYSIKRLEPLYDFTRETSLPEANLGLARVQSALELGDPQSISADQIAAVQSYKGTTACRRGGFGIGSKWFGHSRSRGRGNRVPRLLQWEKQAIS